jgi:hypothetical protein
MFDVVAKQTFFWKSVTQPLWIDSRLKDFNRPFKINRAMYGCDTLNHLRNVIFGWISIPEFFLRLGLAEKSDSNLFLKISFFFIWGVWQTNQIKVIRSFLTSQMIHFGAPFDKTPDWLLLLPTAFNSLALIDQMKVEVLCM